MKVQTRGVRRGNKGKAGDLYMQRVNDAVNELIEAITDTEVYEEYQRQLAELNRNPELRVQIDEYRQKNFELQRANMDPQKLMEETDRFEKEYENFRSIKLVNSFLSSELAFARMMQEVYEDIMEGINFE